MRYVCVYSVNVRSYVHMHGTHGTYVLVSRARLQNTVYVHVCTYIRTYVWVLMSRGLLQTCDQFVGNATYPDIVYSRRWLDGEGGRMLYAWSMHASPTLFLSHSTDQLSCNNSLHSSGLPDHWNVTVPGVNGDFAAAIAFTRLIEFSVTDKKARSVDAFNASLAYMSDDTNCTDKSYCSYRFDSEDLEWDYSASSRTFHLFEGNGSYFPYDFFIRVSKPSPSLFLCGIECKSLPPSPSPPLPDLFDD